MSSFLKSTVAAIALIAVTGTSLATAQTAPEADSAPETAQQTQPQDAAPAEGNAPAEVALPEILQGDAVADVDSRQGPRGGLRVEGTLAETGKDFEAMVSPEGDLIAIRTAPGSALPQALIDALMPESVRGNAALSDMAVLSSIGTRDGAVMIGGQDASGDALRMGFSAEGELMQFGRGDDRRGSRGEMRGDRGERGDRGDRWERGGKGRHDGMRHGPRDGGMRGDRQGRAPMGAPADAAQIDEAAVRSAIEAAGYTELGETLRGARGLRVDALNPEGEPVIVIASPQGEVIRETAR